MTADSHYMDAEQTNPDGLGLLPSIQPQRLRPEAQFRTPVRPISGLRTLTPKPRISPIIKNPALDPVIEHRSPFPPPGHITAEPPRMLATSIKVNPPTKKKQVVKTISQKEKTTTNPNSSSSGSSEGSDAGFLEGSITIGGMEIKKTHAVAGGVTLSGLLIWKLLF